MGLAFAAGGIRQPGELTADRRYAVPSETGRETAPTQRDRHLQVMTEHGRVGWQKALGYNRRALVEAAISR
jgi:hypothetical protein